MAFRRERESSAETRLGGHVHNPDRTVGVALAGLGSGYFDSRE